LETLDTEALDAILERHGPTPIFQQIRHRIEAAITSGGVTPHRRIPSERELSMHFRVSRMTVRQALDALTHEGLLYSMAGKGTFIADRHMIEQPLDRLTSFTHDMERRGMRPASRVLERDIIPATLELSRILALAPGDEVVRIKRVRLADGEPLAIEVVHLASSRVPGLLDCDLESGSLYALLRGRYGLTMDRASQSIEAAEPTPDEQRLLGMERSRPVLRIARLTCDAAGRVVEYVRSVYRGDRYHLTVELS
jgi:GntR family transcriptional regulator